jgi:hypothetical protein
MSFKTRLEKLLLEKVYSNSGLGKWFNRESAGGGPGWDRYDSTGKRVGKCGDSKEGAAYAACLSKQKAKKLGKNGISKFVKRKRRAQSEAGRGKKGTGGNGKKPIFVKTGASKVEESYQPDIFIVEGFADSKFSYPVVLGGELEAYDLFVDKQGNLYEVNGIEEQSGQLLIDFTIHNGINEGQDHQALIKINEEFGLYGEAPENFINEWGELEESAQVSGKKVKLNKIMHGDVKKYKVYVKNDKGNIVKVNFGDPNMEIKRDDPARRKNFRARHHCENPGPRWKAKYWACKTWSSEPVSSMLEEDTKNKAKDPKKWSSCISQAKSKFNVYPSAYANAWAAKCYKKKKGKWKKVAEDFINSQGPERLLNETLRIEQIEKAIDPSKTGIEQSIAYIKQFFGK